MVEQLLDRFIQAETQFQERKTGGGSSGQEPSESRRSSDVESEESDVDDETLPTPAQSAPESGKKRKKRFFFQDLHDVLLLDAVLHDEGIVTVSGVRKPDWKTITASLNGQGLDVDAHTLRSHLRLLVDGYRTESSAWDADPAPLSEKYELLRDYCRKLDGEEDHHRPSNDDQAFDPALETQDRCVETSQEIRVGTKRSHAVTGSVESVECPRTPASPTVVTSNISQDRNAPFQPAEAASTPTIIQSPPHDSTGASEAAWKRQKVELENILERFVSQQADRQREEREQAQVRLSTQQDLQRQTIDLQKRALDMQEKAMNMQERLMALMEKIMDKLG
ncbi:unnamed protein product [Phytophthora lilii]|uniref:Unnamed protein product n=1 Tax=Phytophthora lilii TaxID=2077276 RepID=A0A9W6WNK2_9STRA|nr:unnamed protein product [Phytophthora lilii]